MQLKNTWLPADYPDNENALQVSQAKQSNLITESNDTIYDAISSWWCKPLGHSHPLVIDSIHEQLKLFEHHIPANAWNLTIEKLSNKLVGIFDDMDKVLYASDGSSAIEIAMKLSYETRVLLGDPKRSKFVALSGAYHGETIFTLGVCGLKSYTANFSLLLAENYFIDNVVYVSDKNDPLWNDSQFDHKLWKEYFSQIAESTTALIFEPIVQGAAGMKFISRDFLYHLAMTAKQYDIHVIADEIMVGLGRLGVLSVTKDIIGIEPDIVCFAKNLTAGSIPMSVAVVNKHLVDIYRRYNKPFHHSHTHSCNALAANVAYNYLMYLESSDLLANVKEIERVLTDMFINFKSEFNYVLEHRILGTIAALKLDASLVNLSSLHDIGISNGIYLRNIGDVLYVMLPLNTTHGELGDIYSKLSGVFSSLALFEHRLI